MYSYFSIRYIDSHGKETGSTYVWETKYVLFELNRMLELTPIGEKIVIEYCEEEDEERKEHMLKEKPVGICPACGQTVFNSIEGDNGLLWICPYDLSSENVFYAGDSPVTEENKIASGDYSDCPSSHDLDGGQCEMNNHLPLHFACYMKNGTY